jgi:hypothetical protein
MPVGTVNWIEEGMLGGTIRAVSGPEVEIASEIRGFEFGLTNQFFHGLHPLGWIRNLRIYFDAVEIPTSAITLVIRDQPIPMTLVPKISDIYWHPLETVTIRVESKQPLTTGTHVLTCELAVSTFIFTPEIDRADLYPATELRLTRDVSFTDDARIGA